MHTPPWSSATTAKGAPDSSKNNLSQENEIGTIFIDWKLIPDTPVIIMVTGPDHSPLMESAQALRVIELNNAAPRILSESVPNQTPPRANTGPTEFTRCL